MQKGMIKMQKDKSLFFPYWEENEIDITLKKISKIYNSIVDEYSKQLFENRLMLSITDSPYYARRIIESIKPGINLSTEIINRKRVWIYGCGMRGQRIASMFPETKILGFLDREKKGEYQKIPIVRPQEATFQKNDLILISNLKGANSISNYLQTTFKISKKQILTLNSFDKRMQNKIYFDKRCISRFNPTSGVFIDAGAFDGKDSINFMKSPLFRNNKIIIFESDSYNCRNIEKKLTKRKNIIIFNKGLSDTKTKIPFISERGVSSHFSNHGNCFMETATLDEICKNENVGYIKMDIEGYEKKALMGARNVIKRDNPNMMISLYHKKNDIIDIPTLLLDFNSKYKFALGHYKTGSITDTVLYAFVK